MKKHLAIILLLIGLPTSANISITEIMYDLEGADTGREWIEVQNTSDGEVDLTAYKFFEANTNHKINALQGGNILPAGGFAVIADNAEKFLVDWPGFAGLLFDSAFSLSNTGETLIMKDAGGNTIDEVAYSSDWGAAGDGKSLSLVGGNFVPRSPTPGLFNQENANENEEDGDGGKVNEGSAGTAISNNDDGGGGSQTSASQNKTPALKVYPYAAKIIAPANVFAKAPIAFDAKVTGTTKEELTSGRFVWNLGDFTAREDSSRQKFTHTYEWPGEYIVILDYYRNSSSQTPDASDRLVVKAAAFSVEITNVGLHPDVFVELSNKSSREADLSNFVLGQNDKFFYIPKNTIILPNKKIVLSSKITGFTNSAPVTLFFPTNEPAFRWPNPQVFNSPSVTSPPPPRSTPSSLSLSSYSVGSEIATSPSELPSDENLRRDLLAAGAAKSGFSFGFNGLWLWLLFVGGLVILGLTVIFLMKEEKDEEEFTLLE